MARSMKGDCGRWLPGAVVALVVSAFAASGSAASMASAPGPRASAGGGGSGDDKVERFQREVLASINCEELALQPQLSDDLKRGWIDCALDSLGDALALAEHGVVSEVLAANLRDAIRLDHEALGKDPVDTAAIQKALRFKRITVKTVFRRVVPPEKPTLKPTPKKKKVKLGDCSVQPMPAPSPAPQNSINYDINCGGLKINGIEVIPPLIRLPDPVPPPGVTIWFVNPSGPQHGCTSGTNARSAAVFLSYEVDCRVKGEAREVTVQVRNSTPPQNGDQAVVGVTTKKHRVSVDVVSLQFGPRTCSGSVQTLGGSTYQFSNTCTFDTHSISWTLPAGKQYLGFLPPAGQTGTIGSANGGVNNVLTLTPASGVNPANTTVSVQVGINPPLAAGDVTTNADGVTYMPPIS